MMVFADVILLTLTVRLEFSVEILERLDWMENADAEVFFSSTKILFAGDMMVMADGVPKALEPGLITVDVDSPIDLRCSSNSLFLIFSLMVLMS